MQTISAEQFKQKYGDTGIAVFSQPNKPEKQGYVKNLTEAVGGDLARRIDRFGAIQADPNRNILEKGVQMFGQGAGLATNTLEQTVLQAPGVKQVAGKIGEGMNWLTTSEFSPIKHLGDVIGSSKTLQATTKLYDTNPRFKDTVDALANTVRLGGDVQTIVQSANFAANVTNKVIQEVKDTASSLAETAKLKLAKTTENTPANIMNRVARLNPNDEIKFTKMSGGKTPGQYLVDTGNFNEPRKLILNEANKFATSRASVDNELAKLPGVYKVGSLDDVLTGLKEKAISVSGANVKAPYAGIVDDLITKNANTGLTMEEINTAKRLYERYVKTGYNKIMNADKVEQATNIDSALRNWQVEKARELGFTNISEINKQTQLSKFIIDKLGDKIVGQSGLNGFNLTDWIILAGGSPQSIAGFLTKKFFSSKGVQARIAEIMNQKDIQGLITPKTSITPENINRRVSPQGLKGLPSPEPGLPQSQNFVPIESFPGFTQEGQTKSGFLSSFNKTGDWYIKDIKTRKLIIIPSKLAKLLIPKK